MINPSSFPVDSGLEGCEPRVSEDHFVFSQIGEKEVEGAVLCPHLYLKVGEILEFSTAIGRSIYIV
jgi:hypothetical protein